MKKMIMLFMLFSFVFGVGAAFAQEDFWFQDENEQKIFYITLPDTWKGEWQEEEGVSILHALPKDESLYLSIWALHDVKDLNTATEKVGELIDQLVTDFKDSKWENATVNDIPWVYTDTTAKEKDSGEPVEVSVLFFVPREDSVFILLYFGTTEDRKTHDEVLTKILQSIRRTE
jgi:hypothetical protein